MPSGALTVGARAVESVSTASPLTPSGVSVGLKNWMPTEHTWLCSAHFVSGKKSDNPLSPDYLPTIFNYVLSSGKRESDLIAFERRKQARMKREAACHEGRCP